MSAYAAARLPKYHRLAEDLRGRMASGELAPGDQIPSEPDLCATYALSRGTVRQALQLLTGEGLLVREHGRGTFVAPPPVHTQHFSLASFSEEMRRQQRQPSTQVLAADTRPAPADVAARLHLAVATPVFHIRRLRLADGVPVALETRYLAQALCPQLIDEDLARLSIHWLLVEKYRIPLVRLEHVVERLPIAAADAALLRVPPATPGFHIDRLSFTLDAHGDKVPAVWFQAVYNEASYYIQTHTSGEER